MTTRKMYRTLLFTCLLLMVLGVDRGGEVTSEIPDVSQRINAFTIDLLRHLVGETGFQDNVIVSPQGIFHSLAISYVASAGETRKELGTVLHFPAENQDLLKDLAGLRQQLLRPNKHKRIDLALANSVWLDGTHADFRPEYVREVQDAFDASLHRVAFKQREQVSQEIDAWISQKTHGKIENGVSPDALKSRSSMGIIDEPALVTVNAVYFKADWGSKFDKQSTQERPFHLDANLARDTLMMHQRSLLPYSENDDVKFLEIPYIDGAYSMYVVLPKEVISVRKLLDYVTQDKIAQWKRNALDCEVDVLLPKFEMKRHLDVREALTAMGVKAAFDKRTADFDKMIIKKSEAFRIYISDISHDAWIELHEEGTEAAAATTTTHFSLGCASQAVPRAVQFHADHPFVFMIVHNPSRSILFSGWISTPEGFAQKSAVADAPRAAARGR